MPAGTGYHDFNPIGYLGQSKNFGDFRSHLGGIPINSLLADNYQVKVRDGEPDGGGKGKGSCPCICTGEFPVCYQNTPIRTKLHASQQNIPRLGWSHGNGNDFSIAEGLCNPDRMIQCVLAERVEDGFHSLPFQRPGNGVHLDVGYFRNLFDTDNDFHREPSRENMSLGLRMPWGSMASFTVFI